MQVSMFVRGRTGALTGAERGFAAPRSFITVVKGVGEANNKYISACLDAADVLLGQQNRCTASEELLAIS